MALIYGSCKEELKFNRPEQLHSADGVPDVGRGGGESASGTSHQHLPSMFQCGLVDLWARESSSQLSITTFTAML